MLDNPELTDSYRVRELAPSSLLLGNIGATQLVGMEIETIVGMVHAIDADGLAVYLNVVQELCQPEGDTENNICTPLASGEFQRRNP